MVIIVMGVSGSGKTTIGEKLAAALGWDFYDGDDFHPPANVEKMGQGIPLTDADRQAWLLRLRGIIEDLQGDDNHGVIASSALKGSYRQILRCDDDREDVIFVYLEGSYDLILGRIETRQGHFMKADMLQSQFETLEAPTDAITVDINQAPDEIVAHIIRHLPYQTDH